MSTMIALCLLEDKTTTADTAADTTVDTAAATTADTAADTTVDTTADTSTNSPSGAGSAAPTYETSSAAYILRWIAFISYWILLVSSLYCLLPGGGASNPQPAAGGGSVYMVFAFYLLISIAGICIEWPITKSLKAYTPADVVFPPDPRWAYIVATVITAGILLYILLYVRPHVLFTRNRPVPLYDPDAEQPESGVEGFLQHLRAKGGAAGGVRRGSLQNI